MDYFWVLILLFVVALYAVLEYFLSRALGHTAAELIIRGASKVRNLNVKPNKQQVKTRKTREQENEGKNVS